MKKRFRNIITIFVGIFMILFCFTTSSSDESFYKNAKQTNATINKITQKEKVKTRKRRKYRRKVTVIEYSAHISYEVEENGKLVAKNTVLSDISSNLKVGDTISVYYKGNDVRIRTQEQSDSKNKMMGFVGAIFLLCGIIGVKSSKATNEYDELSGEENIYNERPKY